MLEGLQIGSFMVNTSMLSILLSVMAGFGFVKLRYRKDPRVQALFDIGWTASFIVLLAWKFGTVLFEPRLLWEDPLYLLLLTGGRAEIAAGLLFAAAYVLPRLRRRGIPYRFACDTAAAAVPAFLIAYHILMPRYGRLTDMPWGVSLFDPRYQYHPIHAYWIAAGALCMLAVWIFGGKPGDGRSTETLLLAAGAAGMAISWFEVASPTALGLTTAQLAYAWMLLIGYAIRHLRIIKAERS